MRFNRAFTLMRNFKAKRLNAILLCVFILFAIVHFYKNDFGDKQISAKVSRVIDGDTIEFLNKQENKIYKLRLFGIDAPESKQSYGRESKEYLEHLVQDKEVRILLKDKDKYQRLVGIIFLRNKDINKELVRVGLAHSYKDFSLRYLSSEHYAKANKLGLWQEKNVILPKDFRKNKNTNAKDTQ
ncbi:thermonuclease family protein [Helicobacter turcicus]|uniref:Thermonuclease family protein n=1 Tax=Helicobacter turcicus TaxID=2867412 RepID=A0ABS7JP94_9HELI|nr:thermonuclease family protein [Helicobacter turcicus]MBX7491221.1 thermonuclease family protein [Helicobacter turcicus]MBX7546140.1 thermonuclease family protein [Helicobacter turcicus]